MILVTGGVRSGKSAFAERLAARLSARLIGGGTGGGRGATPVGRRGSVVYLATARVWDEEMAARVARHQARRPPEWATVEAPLDPLEGLARDAREASVVLFDSVDMWVSNRVLEANPVAGEQVDRSKLEALEAALVAEAEALAAWPPGDGRGRGLVLVTLEAGMGVVPPSPLGRAFRDLLGRVNAALAARAEAVYLMVAGLPVDVQRLGRETLRALELRTGEAESPVGWGESAGRWPDPLGEGGDEPGA